MRTFLLSSAALPLAGLALQKLPLPPKTARALGIGLAVAGLVPLAFGGMMLAYSRIGKLRMRALMLAEVAWQGNEHVLDVGTGRGFLLAGAAHNLTTGHATGIDIWNVEDLSNNSADAARHNLTLEGVSDRATVETGDATAMRFASNSFDVVLSLLCLHNIEERQEAACFEIARVLKPGGKAILGDYTDMDVQAAALQAAGLTVVKHQNCFVEALSPMRMIVAQKPM
jgi:ubiquinone/menaquinone biosynthesis C-methylase UbiE